MIIGLENQNQFLVFFLSARLRQVLLYLNVMSLPIFSADRSPDIDADSEEDEQEEDQEIWSNDEMSDSEPTMTEEESRRSRKPSRSKRQHDTHTARVN